jgi:hypothetical protein
VSPQLATDGQVLFARSTDNGITESRGPKSDKRDAYALTEKLRLGSLDKTVLKARAGSPACASSRAFT